MYHHILLPIDGTPQSDDAAGAGISLARSLGARVTALHVLPDLLADAQAMASESREMIECLDKANEARADRFLARIRDKASVAGVPCECRIARAGSPSMRILEAAHEGRCDLIVMASHSEDASEATILASETVKVAALGTIPVLVNPAAAIHHRY